ncbi:MAG: spore photoproduct lyase family protein [Spirochaetota bacterium]
MFKFSHIYVESESWQYPMTREIIARVGGQVIEIQNYKHVFNRPQQDFQVQKHSPKLILAVKHDNYLYPGSYLSPSYGYEHFYYNTLIQNCVYNCDYCYLQGLYNSANVVIFVNDTDFFHAVDEKLLPGNKVYLCISYDTDLLAFEKIVPYTSSWLAYATKHQNLVVELRTKSNYYSLIQHVKPSPNVILAWTVSPDEVIKKYEHKTPRFQTRLKNMKLAIADGWRVRLCLDPILYIENWRTLYLEMVESLFQEISAISLEDISVGVFRVNSQYLKKMRKINDADILYYPYVKNDTFRTYPMQIEKEILDTIEKKILQYAPKEKVFLS